ncbi:MAG: hypothetical protein IJE84_04510 [Clostridia bacterium]|nr:hypothetical protein [Clostridia bacterium]
MKKIADKLVEIAENAGRVYSAGYEKGRVKGREDGYENGYESGYGKGREDGYESGYGEGYGKGYDNGCADCEGRPCVSVGAGYIYMAEDGIYYESPVEDEEIYLDEEVSGRAEVSDGTLCVSVGFGWSSPQVERIRRISLSLSAPENDGASVSYIYPRDMTVREEGGSAEASLILEGYRGDLTGDEPFRIEVSFELYDNMTEGVDKRTVFFEDWHSGTSKETLLSFEHGLGAKPRYVAVIADDVSAIESVTPPAATPQVIVQADGLYNAETQESYVRTYLRHSESGMHNGAMDAGAFKLIHGWDEKRVYINSAYDKYAWAPASVTTYTMICIV